MKDEQPEPKQRLLEDLLADDPAGGNSAKQHAMAVFRQARLFKHVARVSRVAALIAVLAVGAFLFRAQLVKDRPGSQAFRGIPDRAVEQEPTSGTADSRALPTLSDEELLASFPPHSCYLAEVDGRKILVFADSSLQKKYLR
jgi:hypothetical protein